MKASEIAALKDPIRVDQCIRDQAKQKKNSFSRELVQIIRECGNEEDAHSILTCIILVKVYKDMM